MVKMGSATHYLVEEYFTKVSAFKDSLYDGNYLWDVSYLYCQAVGALRDAYISGVFSDSEFVKELTVLECKYHDFASFFYR